jgi:hypothetical protein
MTISDNMSEKFFNSLLEADIKEENFNIYQFLVNLSKIYFINSDFSTSIVIHKYLLNKLINEKAPPQKLKQEFYNLAVKYNMDKNYQASMNVISSYLREFETSSITHEDMLVGIKSYILYIVLKNNLNQDIESLESYGQKALAILSKYSEKADTDEVYSLLLQIYSQLIMVARRNKNFNRSLEYGKKSLAILENSEINIAKSLTFSIYQQLSLTYENMHKEDLANQYFEKAKTFL